MSVIDGIARFSFKFIGVKRQIKFQRIDFIITSGCLIVNIYVSAIVTVVVNSGFNMFRFRSNEDIADSTVIEE